MDNLDKVLHRQQFNKLTEEIVSNATDYELDQLVMDVAETHVSTFNSVESEGINSLPPALKMLYVTWIYEGQINNGGLFQFYWNGYAYLEQDIITSLRFFKAKKHLELFTRAIKAKKEEKWLSKVLRLFSSYSTAVKYSNFDDIDDEFYELQESLESLRALAIRKHPNNFVLS